MRNPPSFGSADPYQFNAPLVNRTLTEVPIFPPTLTDEEATGELLTVNAQFNAYIARNPRVLAAPRHVTDVTLIPMPSGGAASREYWSSVADSYYQNVSGATDILNPRYYVDAGNQLLGAVSQGVGAVLGFVGDTAAPGYTNTMIEYSDDTRMLVLGSPSSGELMGQGLAFLPVFSGTSRVSGELVFGRAPTSSAGARGFSVHQDVVAEYVKRGGTDLGVSHQTTDVAIGGVGTPQVSIVSVDLAAPSYNRTLPAGRQHPLTGVLKQKAFRSAVDPAAGVPRIVHVETYGPAPTAAQQAAIQAAIKAAAGYDPPVILKVGHRP